MVNTTMTGKQIPNHHQKRLDYLSTYFRVLRQNDGLSMKDVSEEIDLHLNTIAGVEKSRNFTLLTLFELADFYEIDVEDLFIGIK